ncbi:hypothetical protein PFDG_02977 [Plasmodium falciparum Dd2]|uniref:Uncharacterized protein n=1 Tax=Plasmodium falciparum (isolate Dd2) TaxID=57267 RepID=A0A0L7M2D3_PLAF4|nr:hypothetical protein PFDG_02977 [Plasmodium falciparum Dd2]
MYILYLYYILLYFDWFIFYFSRSFTKCCGYDLNFYKSICKIFVYVTFYYFIFLTYNNYAYINIFLLGLFLYDLK